MSGLGAVFAEPGTGGGLRGLRQGQLAILAILLALAAMAWLISCDEVVPKSVNSGMSTNWMPGAGRGCTPGFDGLALSIAVRVGWAKADATFRYCGLE